jgi:hypothetical protein
MYKELGIICILAFFAITSYSQTFLTPNLGLRYQTIDDRYSIRENFLQYPIVNVFTGIELNQHLSNNISFSIEADYNLIKYEIFPYLAPAIYKLHYYRLGISLKYFIAENWQMEGLYIRSSSITDLYYEGSLLYSRFDDYHNHFIGLGLSYWTKNFNYSLRTYFWIYNKVEISPGKVPHVVASFTVGYPIKITGWKPFQSSKKVRCPKF